MKKQLLALCVTSLVVFSVVTPLSKEAAAKSNMLSGIRQETEEVEKHVELLFPVNGENVSILKPKVNQFISAMHEQAKDIKDDQVLHDFYVMAPDANSRYYGVEFTNDTDKVRVKDYADNSTYMAASKEVMLTFAAEGHTPDKVKVSMNEDMSDAIELTDISQSTYAYYVGVNQLFSNRTYYWQVFENDEAISEVASFKTEAGFRMMTMNSVRNVRDMGGRTVKLKTGVDENGNNVYVTKRIKQGLIYRGGELVEEDYIPSDSTSTHSATLKTGDAEYMVNELEIGQQIDFRGAAESNNLTESPLKSYFRTHYSKEVDVNYLRLDNMSAYDDFFSITSSKSYYSDIKNMFKAFANAENRHVYFNCWGGADRTGTAGFLLGSLLGMSLTDLVVDFELTSFSNNYRPHTTNDAKKVYRFPSLLTKIKILTTKSDSSATYWSKDKPISQIIEEILIDRFEVTKEDIDNLRNNLLED